MRTEKLEKHEPDPRPTIVGEMMTSAPRMRTIKSKERIKVTTLNGKSTKGKATTTCEESGNMIRICVNLMPVLASAMEPVEEEKEEENKCVSENEPETSSKNKLSEETHDNPNVSHTGLTSARVTETKHSVSPRFILPLITQPKPAECQDCQRAKSCHTLLPPISLSEQTTTVSSNASTKDCGGDGAVTEQAADSTPWIYNPLHSKSVS